MHKVSFAILALISLFITGIFLPASLESAEEQHGGDIWFPDTKKFPPVLFSHKKHIDAGNQCTVCHTKIFKKKKGSTNVGHAMTMKAMKNGEFCGTCHDGVKAFKVGGTCKKCHIKTE